MIPDLPIEYLPTMSDAEHRARWWTIRRRFGPTGCSICAPREQRYQRIRAYAYKYRRRLINRRRRKR